MKRNIILFVLLAAALVVIAACAPAAQPTAVPPTTAPTAAPPTAVPATATIAATAPPPVVATTAPQPTSAPSTGAKRGGTIVVGVTSDPGQFNPGLTTASGIHAVTGNIYNGLLQFDDKLDPLPSLAESWEISPDGKTYTFKLVEGVTWHDGKPFTSADVKFTFENILLKFHSRTKAGLENALEAIETPDANTVVFKFKNPYAPLLRRLDVVEASILPKHIRRYKK